MKKAGILSILAVFAMLLAWHEGITSAMLSLLITGHIPGTHVIIPFWAMMACYCLLITLIVTLYVEDTILVHRTTKAAKVPKSRMPHRRYSHI